MLIAIYSHGSEGKMGAGVNLLARRRSSARTTYFPVRCRAMNSVTRPTSRICSTFVIELPTNMNYARLQVIPYFSARWQFLARILLCACYYALPVHVVVRCFTVNAMKDHQEKN